MSLLDQLDQYAAADITPVVTRNRQGSVEISKQNIGSAAKRPPGWAEIRLRRVFLKEWEDRKNGVDEDDILDKRYQRELEVIFAQFLLSFYIFFQLTSFRFGDYQQAEQEMIAELGVKGKIALFEKGFKTRVKKTFKKEEIALFMAASSASLQHMNDTMNKLTK